MSRFEIIQTRAPAFVFFIVFFIAAGYFYPVSGAEQINPEKETLLKADKDMGKTAEEISLIGRNPFLFSQEEIMKESREVIDSASLSAIFVSASSRSYAIIDGRILKQGDKFRGKEIVSITSAEVELIDVNGRYVIFIDKK